MAALGQHVGHSIQRNCRFLVKNIENFAGNRRFGWTPALQQQIEEACQKTSETIVIPRKKTWSKEAVLEALASTVSRDFTASAHHFQDDPYLTPKNLLDSITYNLSQNSGRSAAKYFIDNNPKFFTKDFAEPHIPSLMPEIVSPRLEEVSEEALKERINLRKVTAAVDLYDQLLQAGTAVSMETTHDLLDLICLHCDRDPSLEEEPELEELEEESDKKVQKKKSGAPHPNSTNSTWKENNNAERIFNLLPERDTRCYSALIRGMVMHRASEKAFQLYADMLNDRLTPDIHIFNALLSAAVYVRRNYTEKLDLIMELLKQMNKQEVQPSLQTFNNVLSSLRRCGAYGRSKSLETLNEMKALGIAPSLASYRHILSIFELKGLDKYNAIDILESVMSVLEGKSFTCQDHGDVYFFLNAMQICVTQKDMEMAYKVYNLVEVGENRRLLGSTFMPNLFYGKFFSLLCMMEHIDVVLRWYRQHYPSLWYPGHKDMGNLLQALDTNNRLDLLPTVWKDLCYMRYDTRSALLEELLSLMARDTHSPEVQKSFGECALDVKKVFDENKMGLEWSRSALSCVTSLLLRGGKTQQAWDMLPLFESNNLVPSKHLIEECLEVCRSSGSPERAVELVQLSAAFSLPATSRLATFTLAEFELTEEQRAVLSDLESADLMGESP